MAEETDLIKEQIEQTRGQLSDNIAYLETRVREKVEMAKENVRDTVDSIRSTVEHFRPSYHVEHHPWALLGASVATGIVCGAVVGARAKTVQLPKTGNSGDRQENHRPGVVKQALLSTGLLFAGEAARKLFPNYSSYVDRICGNLVEQLESKKSN